MAAGAAPVGSEALELQRIVSGIPRYGVDIRERDLPQETEQARALNFNKGCYVGQEIVERIRSRGAVHRKFTGFLADGTAQIAPGSKIVAGEKEVGEITSAASLPGTRQDRGAGIHPARNRCAGARSHDWFGEGDCSAVAGARTNVCRREFGGTVRREAGASEHCANKLMHFLREKSLWLKRKEQSGFKVTDRRLFTAEGELRGDVPEEVETPKAPAPAAVQRC